MALLRQLCVCLVFAVWATAGEAGECTLRQAASLAIDRDFPGRVVVDVSIAGKPRHFLVDTGAVFTTIYQNVADELGLTTQPVGANIQIYNVDGTRTKEQAKLPDLTIGTIKGKDIPVLVQPRSFRESSQIDGVLAPDILSQFDLDLDFGHRKLNLVAQDHCPGDVVYWSNTYAEADFETHNGHIALSMTLDAHDVSAALDTGAVDTYIDEVVSRRVFGLARTTPGIEFVHGAGRDGIDRLCYRFKRLSISGLAIDNPLIYIMQDRAVESFSRDHDGPQNVDPAHAPHLDTTDLLLGMDVLSNLHLYIAYKEHKIYLTDAGAH